MQTGQLTALVIGPSLFSGVVSFIASTALLSAANWPALMQQPAIHDYLLGPDGLITLLKTTDSDGHTSVVGFFSQTLLNNVIVLLAALVVGLVLLIILEVVRRARTDAVRITAREGRMRLGARLLVSVLWLIFFEVTLKIILPFCILASQVGLHALWAWQGFAYLLFGTALLWACLHVHVIFMRLFLLRIRVFGGEQAIIEAESRY